MSNEEHHVPFVKRIRVYRPIITAYTRLPAVRIINHTLPANKPLIEIGLAGPAAGEAEALARFKQV